MRRGARARADGRADLDKLRQRTVRRDRPERVHASRPGRAKRAPGAQSAALGSPEETEEPLSPLPELADGGAFEKLKEALEDAFERLSAENVYRLISNKKVDLSWEKAIAVFAAR